MARDARFWRNVTIIAAMHVAGLIALLHWDRAATSTPPNIVWMSNVAEAALQSSASPMEMAKEARPASTPDEEVSTAAPVKSEIELPTVTPIPTPKPKVTPTATPKPTPKPTAKPKLKSTVAAKVTPSATPKKTAKKIDQPDDQPAKKKDQATSSDRAISVAGQHASQAARASEFAWYGRMLHDRFLREWAQPTSIVATGAKMTAVAKVRIEKDGRVSNFAIVEPSGNVVVDESVAAVAKRVTQVDPLPNGFISGPYYEVKINFELNAE